MIEYLERTSEPLESSPESATYTQLEALHRQGERMGDNLSVFVNNREKHLMGEHALDVTRLQAFVDAIRDEAMSPELRQAAAWQVMDHITGSNSPTENKDVYYMFVLWNDLPKVDVAANRYRTRLEDHDTEQSRVVLKKLDGEIEITEDDWQDIRIGIDIPEIVKLSRQVNVESILARSALVLDRVATATAYDNEVLKDILSIETVYAPLLDLLGLHAYEATLRHHAEKARLMATGRKDVIQAYNDVSEYIGSVRESGLVNKVITDVVGVNLENHDFSFIIENEETAYGSKNYFSAIRFEGVDAIPARLISRTKSPGSFAHKKLHDYKGENPQDVYAGTVVVEDVHEMVQLFHAAYGNIQARSEECDLVSAPSKDHPVHIKGKKAYVETVMSLLGGDFENQVDISTVSDDVEEPFQVLKVTFNIHNDQITLPVEIQFQTVEDRNRSRLGGASHFCFKGKNGDGLPGTIPGTSSDLLSVNLRKWAMLEGGEEIYSDVDQDAKENQIKEIQNLQRLFMEVSFEMEPLSGSLTI